MLAEFIVQTYGSSWGPLRLLSTTTFLSVLGALLTAATTVIFLPKLAPYASRDSGRNFAHNADASVGKPTGVGLFMIAGFAICVAVMIPFNPQVYLCVAAVIVASLIGFADDRKPGGFGELTLGLSDLLLAGFVSAVLLWGGPTVIWLPFWSEQITLPYAAGVAIFTAVVWLSVNALNCNDGVDGLSGMLALMTLMALGFILYSVVGNIISAEYLLIPFNPSAATWVIVTCILCGTIVGYLWYNAPPSTLLMGDAGSRPLGLFIGICIVVSGNPLIILFVAFIILVNGVTGLGKVVLIRLFKIRIFRNISFPLHDHVRKTLGWSNAQVLIRFMLLHFVSLGFLVILLLKVR